MVLLCKAISCLGALGRCYGWPATCLSVMRNWPSMTTDIAQDVRGVAETLAHTTAHSPLFSWVSIETPLLLGTALSLLQLVVLLLLLWTRSWRDRILPICGIGTLLHFVLEDDLLRGHVILRIIVKLLLNLLSHDFLILGGSLTSTWVRGEFTRVSRSLTHPFFILTFGHLEHHVLIQALADKCLFAIQHRRVILRDILSIGAAASHPFRRFFLLILVGCAGGTLSLILLVLQNALHDVIAVVHQTVTLALLRTGWAVRLMVPVNGSDLVGLDARLLHGRAAFNGVVLAMVLQSGTLLRKRKPLFRREIVIALAISFVHATVRIELLFGQVQLRNLYCLVTVKA